MLLFSADAKKKLKKLKKLLSKVGQKNSTPKLPNWPKQKNSCSKLWLLDQLYIELGLGIQN